MPRGLVCESGDRGEPATLAANDLAALNPTLPKPNYLAPEEVREATLQSWNPQWPAQKLQEVRDVRKRLSATRSEVDVQVGE